MVFSVQVENMPKTNKFYYRYFVKSHIPYYLMIVMGIAFFLYYTSATEVSVLETFEGTYAEDRLIINQVVDYPIEKVYAYHDRSDKVIAYKVLRVTYIDESYTVLYVDKSNESAPLEGTVKIDVEKEYTSLLSVVSGLKKRYTEKEMA